MKLLFLIDGALDPGGATQTLSLRLCEALAQSGNEVFVLESTTGEGTRKNISISGVNVIQVLEKTEKPFIDWIFGQQNKGSGNLKTALRLLTQPRKLLLAIKWAVFKKRPLEEAYIKNIRKLNVDHHFDWVVAVSAPHYTSFALGKIKHASFKKALYWLDPFSTKEHSKESLRQKEELQLLEEVDAVFVTQLMYKENKHNALQKYINKMRPLYFPSLIEHEQTKNTFYKNENKKDITCVFVGRFASTIRQPEPLIELFEHLPANFTLTIVGDNSYFKEGGSLEKYSDVLQDRLIVTGFLPLAEAFGWMQKADILVNLGNLNNNQLPSKIFDYVSTGKPILNLYQIDNCASLPILAKYPNNLNVKTCDFSVEALEGVVAFCQKNAGKQLGFEEVEAIFAEYTPQSVAYNFNSDLKNLEPGKNISDME